MRIRHPRRKGVLALVGAVVLLTVAGVAYATIPDSGGVYTACRLNGVGTIRLIDPSSPSTSLLSHCTSFETQITWNQKGQKGDTGAPGQKGDTGAPGQNGVSPTVEQLSAGDSNCPTGGAAITDAAGTTAYVCNGQNGKDGQSFAGTFTSPSGQFSLSVGDNGVEIVGPGTSISLDGTGSVTIKGDHVATVASGDETVTVGGSRTETVGQNENITVAGNRTETVDGNENVTVAGNRTQTVDGNETVKVVGNRTETVSNDENIKVGGNRTETVSSDENIKVGGVLGLRAGAALNLDASFLGLNASSACRGVARIGDMVDPTGLLIATGSATVCVGP